MTLHEIIVQLVNVENGKISPDQRHRMLWNPRQGERLEVWINGVLDYEYDYGDSPIPREPDTDEEYRTKW